jgi:chaperonin cofactor prefoldin
MKTVAVIGFLFFSVLSSVASAPIEKEWESFKLKFNKTYESAEQEAERYKIFQENIEYIQKHNQNKTNTFKLKIFRNADKPDSEFERP